MALGAESTTSDAEKDVGLRLSADTDVRRLALKSVGIKPPSLPSVLLSLESVKEDAKRLLVVVVGCEVIGDEVVAVAESSGTESIERFVKIVLNVADDASGPTSAGSTCSETAVFWRCCNRV